MSAPVKHSQLIPCDIAGLAQSVAKSHGAAQAVVEAWDLTDDHRVESQQYHMGRRDAYDVILWLIAEMRRTHPEL